MERDVEKLFFETYNISTTIDSYECDTVTGFCENEDFTCKDCGLSKRIVNKRQLTPMDIYNLISLFGKDQYYFQICQSDFGRVETSITWIDFDKSGNMERRVRLGYGDDLKQSLCDLFTDYTIKKMFYKKVRNIFNLK